MKDEPERINRIVRHRKGLHGNVADGKLRTSFKDSPISASVLETVATKGFCREPIAINRQIEFTAENFQSANMIGVFVREKDAVELFRDNAALLQAQRQLPRAQPAIDKNFAMIGCNQRAVSRAPAAK